MPYKLYHVPRVGYVEALAEGLRFQCPVESLRFLLVVNGRVWGTTEISFPGSHPQFMTAHPVTPKPGKSPLREPSRFFVFFGSQVGTWKWDCDIGRSTAPLWGKTVPHGHSSAQGCGALTSACVQVTSVAAVQQERPPVCGW